jgi:hypothetical protein
MSSKPRHRTFGFLILVIFLAACGPVWGSDVANPGTTGAEPYAQSSGGTATFTPYQPESSTVTPTPTATASFTPTSTITTTPPPAALWISPAVPATLRQVALSSGIPIASDQAAATLHLDATTGAGSATWIYALVSPFPTLIEGVSYDDIRHTWTGGTGGPFGGKPFRMDAATLAAFTAVWGPPAPRSVYVVPAERLIDLTWTERPIWSIVPFEALEPRWKVLTVDGQSPIHKDFDPAKYPLKVTFTVQPAAFQLPSTNRDPAKLTVLVMTGVTALVRGTADRMERKGILYPGQQIRDVLRAADLTHISNEVPFYAGCPTPNPYTSSLRFCSDPRYIALLEDIGTKIVELTGNHMQDYGSAALSTTLDMYTQRGWTYYGGGKDLADAQKYALVEDHGNKLAFLGCNPAGPPVDWATATSPGSAPCDYDQMRATIGLLRSAGYLPVVTLQYNEYYMTNPTSYERKDFRSLAEAGAIIVSGSQAHVPQIMEFDNGSFVHYGLGNLFFDQMSYLLPSGQRIPDTRYEFVDRHIIYDGKYLGVELLTYMLEDYAQPRPMTTTERNEFLTGIFTAAGWAP